MSLETTYARAETAAAEHAWRDHRRNCPPCVTAARARKPDRTCARGGVLYRSWKHAEHELARQRELDKQPITGQAALW